MTQDNIDKINNCFILNYKEFKKFAFYIMRQNHQVNYDIKAHELLMATYMSLIECSTDKDITGNIKNYIVCCINKQFYLKGSQYNWDHHQPLRTYKNYIELTDKQNLIIDNTYNDDQDELINIIFNWCEKQDEKQLKDDKFNYLTKNMGFRKYRFFIEYYKFKMTADIGEELTHKQLGEKYNVSDGTVRVGIHSVIKEIKLLFKPKYND